MRFKDRVIIVTGGAQGIGKEIALRFAQEKGIVIIIDINKEQLALAEKEINSYSQGESFCVDITNMDNLSDIINKIIDKYSKIDILVNNAGITRDNLILRLSENDWDQVINVNLKGAFNCCRLTVKHMVKQRYGKIINISSVIGIIGNAGQVNYSASKAALIGVTKSLAKELGSRNITVNAVAPGYIKTAMTDRLPDKVRNDMLSRIPLGRLGEPKDVAEAVLFLASEEASYITGQVLVVDGGLI